jgi:hypothetical protein
MDEAMTKAPLGGQLSITVKQERTRQTAENKESNGVYLLMVMVFL